MLPADQPETSEPTEIDRLEEKLSILRGQWTANEISAGFFFSTVRQVEQQLQQLRNEQASRALQVVRSREDFAGVRDRWYGNKLDMSQKRAYIREALHAVIIHPAGRGRAAFNPGPA